MKFLDFLKKNRYYCLAFFLIAWSIWVNAFPDGFVFSGGDTIQLIDARENFWRLFYDWQGRGSFFYFIFYLLDWVGLSNTAQASWYLGIFLLGSFLSFDIFIRLVFPKTDQLKRVLVSLFYAFNLFTLFVFSSNWGYSHYLTFYIFVPVLVGLYIRFLESEKQLFGALFCLVLFLGSSGFANPAFFISFSFFLIFLTLVLWAVGKVSLDKIFWKNIFLLGFFILAVNAYWIWPLAPQMSVGVANLYSGNALDLNWWLRSTSAPVINSFRLIHYSEDYFPDNFPYAFLLRFQWVFYALSFLPILFILGKLFGVKKMEKGERKYFLAFLSLLGIFTLLSARVRFPFETINHLIFNTWGLNTLRSWEKTAIFLPFIFSVLLLIVFLEMKKQKRVVVLAALLLLLPLPFWAGKFQQNMSYRFSQTKNKDYQAYRLSFLVKIPQEYYSIQNDINSEKAPGFVATLPYNYGETGSGVSSYPKWKFLGADITQFLYNKKFIEANNAYFSNWLFSRDFNESEADPKWLAELLGMMDARWIIYHKDVGEKYQEQSQAKMEALEGEGLIVKVSSNDYFDFYRIKDRLIVPYISFGSGDREISKNTVRSLKTFSDIRENSREAEFEKINPKKFIVEGGNFHPGDNLFLAEVYDANWKAYAELESGEKIELADHFRARGYANGWKIPAEEKLSRITIEYYPIRLFFYGLGISFSAALFLILYLARPVVLDFFKKQKS